MTPYNQAINFLNEQLPMFSKQGQSAIKKGLENVSKICEFLDNPQLKFPSVHIAGTNGKGSTSHMIAGALQQAGYKTGLYTSPHLIDLRERVRINGIPVSEDFVVDFVEKTKHLIPEIQPSYFELNVAMAFMAFAEQKVDIAVIETGLGGRLDSTNIITPVLSVITNIGLDHTQILGDTLPLIAAEKAGIIKEKVPVVVGETHPETEQVFFLNALAKNTVVVYADSLWELVKVNQDAHFQYFKVIHKADQKMYDLKTDLMGNFQVHNIKTVLTASTLLYNLGWELSLDKVLNSLSHVKSTTGLRGRWEYYQQQPTIILDVAHNPDGLEYLKGNLDNLKKDGKSKLHIVCGFVKDKDVPAALSYFPKDAIYYFTQANIPRAMPANELAQIGNDLGLTGNAYKSVDDAIIEFSLKVVEEDVVLITGSFFIVGEALVYLEGQKNTN
ncbi:bifunctional folylpolyglutamate synthase/dihydrofolate synthase [Taibaiella lutea]|uniref:Dihydrofolate synthase/folylpolyglutamate synthase n=1 Tax=Taibaiella lutea TaxID=2608001 RepID=A0A5M6CNJ2_9BACT|nr:folylpolyglutamate synthase/dihydrofolate synthase family protein [Taibaiella lutea]KAA5536576.1 bifunctional folylpolyglutamate synthase/dihydrofolate synthase [Taibaiella lutea]